jgi:hypothetical protein
MHSTENSFAPLLLAAIERSQTHLTINDVALTCIVYYVCYNRVIDVLVMEGHQIWASVHLLW